MVLLTIMILIITQSLRNLEMEVVGVVVVGQVAIFNLT